MKTTLLLLSVFCFACSSCKKEEPDALYIKGHLIEHGSGNPIINSTVYLVRTTSGIWAPIEVLDEATTNLDGYYELDNLTRESGYTYYLVGMSSYHYEMERMEYEPFQVNSKTHWKDVYLYRKATMHFHVINTSGGSGRYLNIWTPRDYEDGFEGSNQEWTFDMEVNGFAENKISYSVTNSGVTELIDTVIYVDLTNPPTFTITN